MSKADIKTYKKCIGSRRVPKKLCGLSTTSCTPSLWLYHTESAKYLRTVRIVLKERPKPGYSINPSRKSKRAKTRWITKRLRLKSGNGSLKSKTKSDIRTLVKMWYSNAVGKKDYQREIFADLELHDLTDSTIALSPSSLEFGSIKFGSGPQVKLLSLQSTGKSLRGSLNTSDADKVW